VWYHFGARVLRLFGDAVQFAGVIPSARLLQCHAVPPESLDFTL
jgi:hypothetical protein